MNLRPALFALVLLAGTVAATPAPKAPPAAPPPAVAAPAAPAAPPQDATSGFDVNITGFAQADANVRCHMTYVLPMAVKFGDKTLVWACVK